MIPLWTWYLQQNGSWCFSYLGYPHRVGFTVAISFTMVSLTSLVASVYLHFCTYHHAFKLIFRFAHTNPLHMDVFQSVVRFEVEVVAMTAALLGSKEKASGGQICGNMTSGGTESILLAVKTSRDYMKAKRGITRPEMYVYSCLSCLFSSNLFLIWELFMEIIFFQA